MSRTFHKFRDTTLPAKTKRKLKKTKDFGFTNGVHSAFSAPPLGVDDRNEYLTSIMNFTSSTVEREVVNKTYPVKGTDFIKYGYGNGTKKENRVKNYKKEIE